MCITEPILVMCAHLKVFNKDSAVNILLTMPELQFNDVRFSKSIGTIISQSDSLKINLAIDTVKSGNVLFYDALVQGRFHHYNLASYSLLS